MQRKDDAQEKQATLFIHSIAAESFRFNITRFIMLRNFLVHSSNIYHYYDSKSLLFFLNHVFSDSDIRAVSNGVCFFFDRHILGDQLVRGDLYLFSQT